MKKTTVILILCIFSLSLLLSGGMNYQKIYSVDDTIWDDISSLYILSGRSLPSTTGPWSGEELLTMLEKVDITKLSSTGRELYESVKSRLDGDASLPVFKASLEIAPELYIQTNTTSLFFQTRDNWVRGWDKQKQAVNINTEEHIGENFYGFFDFSIGVAKDWKSNGDTSRKFGDSPLWTNIPFLLSNDMKQLDFNFPLRAFVAAGGRHWTLFVGRDKLSWGNGKTGNFVIGDHVKYHNAAYFTAFDDTFKYTFLISAFPHPQNYYTEIKDAEGKVTGMKYSINGTGGDCPKIPGGRGRL